MTYVQFIARNRLQRAAIFCAIIAGFPAWWKIFTAATFSPHEYFSVTLESSHYCTKIAVRCMQ